MQDFVSDCMVILHFLVEKGIKVHMLNFEDHVYKLLLEGWVSLIAKEPEPENKG